MSRSGFVPAALLCGLLSTTLIGHAQPSPPGSEVEISACLSVDKLTPGSGFRAAVVLDLAQHWHVNANPVSLEGFIPTTLDFQPPASIVIDHITYPPGERTKVGWNDEPVALYTGRAVIFAEGHVIATARPGPVRIEGSVRYQACDDHVCHAPKSVPITIETAIANAGYTPQPQHPEIFATAGTTDVPLLGTAPVSPQNTIEQLIQQRGWLIALGFVLLGGLALNLTPCVYPMIAITVSYFGGQGQRSMSRAFTHAFTYFLGIVLTYSALGLLAATTGGLFGALLLSMFGLYEMQPPQALMQKVTGLSSKAGYVGIFFLGATVGVIAAPCLAPILVALLVYVGQRGDPWIGWWMFFTLAVGLGLPYVVLGTFSGLLPRLPKSGAWMVWVKRVFGALLIGVAIWITATPIDAGHGGGIAWTPYSPEKIQQATAAHRPVIIDFYADWCLPCKEMEKRTFPDSRVIEKSRQFLMLKADLTRTGSPGVDKLTREFHIFGVPTTVFISPAGQERTDLRLVGFVGPDEYLKAMDAALIGAPTNSPPRASAPDVPPQLLKPF